MSLKPFTIPYRHNGRDYTLELYAHDYDDARARLRSAFYQGREPEEVVFRATAPAWLGKMIGGTNG